MTKAIMITCCGECPLAQGIQEQEELERWYCSHPILQEIESLEDEINVRELASFCPLRKEPLWLDVPYSDRLKKAEIEK